MDLLNDLKNLSDFKSLIIKLASSEDIRRWSRGEVTKPETINYRTLKPEKDGLFDERIFGPTKDWECYCGKYKRIRYKGVVCDKCGVEVTQSRVRRERMGHISLASPVAHVWFFKGAPSRLSLVLDVAPRAIEQVVYFARYLVLSVEDKKKEEAIKGVEKAWAVREQELKDSFEERRDQIKVKLNEEKEKTEKKIKNKEQVSLATSEIDLEFRKKEAALAKEEKNSLQSTKELFEGMISLIKNLDTLSVLSEEEYEQLTIYEASDFFEAKMGADAILTALSKINIEELTMNLRRELTEVKNTTTPRYVKIAKRLKTIDGMRRAKVDPTSMIVKVLPVLPPDLRPMVQLSGGRFATSDLNDLYRRVINRNNRLKHLINLGAPEIILRNEKRMLQESVDSLIDASQRKATRRGRGRQPLRSLSDMLKGKQGRFRQNLLGKRVDYSGRSVIVVGPDLKLNQCGIPKEMALEMFKPFVLKEMILRGIAPNVKSAKNLLEKRPPEVFDILEEITKKHPVILNRAPTLHKLSIQAFYPILIEGNAIRLHPAICSGFNADFDGDQMAVHVPLSKRALEEAESLMLPQNNLLRPADGSPISTPASKEMALGVYFLTSLDPNRSIYSTIFADKTEAITAYQAGKFDLRQLINVRINGEILETTAGRILFNEVLPFENEYINEPVTSTLIKRIFARTYATKDTSVVVEMIDAVKDLGFFGGTVSGFSFGIFDARVHPDKQKIISEADGRIAEHDANYAQGLITLEEKRNLNQKVWIETTEDLTDKTWDLLDSDNPIKMVIDAKVGRTSRDQVKQLAAIRGLVVDPLGKIVEMPIKSNFREGLSVFEYFTSARGARKGLADRAIKTAESGYLTRRLVDVAHDAIIRLEDCGTKESILIAKSDKRQMPFASRLMGRVVADDVKSPKGKKVIAKANIVLSEEHVKEIIETGAEELNIRSPLTCEARHGLCALCYGRDLVTRDMVSIGTPVGVIAAQSIGEPGTQLTMRTFHTGGIVGLDITQGLPRVEELFEARTPKYIAQISEISGKVKIEEKDDEIVVKVKSTGLKPQVEKEYSILPTAELSVEDGQLIAAGAPLSTGYLDVKEVLAVSGLRAAQKYISNGCQEVYESQGVAINDKHFEVIVKKMSEKVRVESSGDTVLLPGELIDKNRFQEENAKVLAEGGEPATALVTILGITRAALYTESFLSAASFQETTRILTEAALEGKTDKLLGLKENVIIGRLIPTSPERAAIK
ncbi:MAG: DNA-directed RNA polymerase subunit beta' [Candidatus Woesebacteria bacterium GW2011_GWB1_38_5]|uniref:DNA-directed RNA polymerase subunit beta' n=1 Tax=Candidatus Woesebacteria bacterium GW2011_GWB1_38_5 TaxID=1618568 RepID=A0A0G0ML67_9BACT|nr:MAG: DNA-directed RNA polymerase subunit beta' [Candidatus Woesebacteria bacterium GW2011_GWB1_38_5]